MKTGTREWSDLSLNTTIGCSNNCRYCYSAVKTRKENKDWTKEKIKSSTGITKKIDGIIMYPTRHDISEYNLEVSKKILKETLEVGNKVLIVSKPKKEVILSLAEYLKEYKENIEFRFSIGAYNNDILKYWEPGATSFEERLDTLKELYEKGYKTSVSAEPLLTKSIKETIELIEKLYPFITTNIWIGKLNKPKERIFDKDESENEIITFQEDKNNILKLASDLKKYEKISWKDSIKEIIKNKDL